MGRIVTQYKTKVRVEFATALIAALPTNPSLPTNRRTKTKFLLARPVIVLALISRSRLFPTPNVYLFTFQITELIE